MALVAALRTVVERAPAARVLLLLRNRVPAGEDAADTTYEPAPYDPEADKES